MNDLPEGFVLDDGGGDLPPGFQLDDQQPATPPTQAQQPSGNSWQVPLTDTDKDVIESLKGTPRALIEGTIGLPGDVEELAGKGVDWLSEKMGSDYRYPRILPNTEDINWATSHLIGESYKPKTAMGEGMQLGGMLMAPWMVPGKVAKAGQATKEMLESVGPVASDAEKGVVGAIEESRNTANAMWEQLRNSGAKYDFAEYKKMVGNLDMKLKSLGMDKYSAPKATKQVSKMSPKAADAVETVANAKLKSLSTGGLVDDTFNALKNGTVEPLDFTEIDSIRKAAGEMTRNYTASETERKAAGIIRDAIDDFEMNVPVLNEGAMTASEFRSLSKAARAQSLINIKARTLNDAMEQAKTYQSGFEAGLRNQFSNLLRSKKGQKLFNDEEKAALMDVAKGSYTHNALRMLGRFGVDFSNLGNTASLLPGGLVGGASLAGNPLLGVGLTTAATGAKYASRKLTEKAADRAMRTVLAGPESQGRARTLEEAVRDQRRLAMQKRLPATAPGVFELNRRYGQ